MVLDPYPRQGGWAAANADFILGFQTYSGAPAEPDADLGVTSR
jgi:hypothetical protein